MEESNTSDTDLAALVGRSDRGALIGDCVALLDGEVKGKPGLSGMALKSAYATIKKIKPGFVTEVIDGMMDDWIERLQPHFAAWRASGQGTFSEFVSSRRDAIANELLTVTDERAATTRHKTVKKLYGKLRPSAQRHVADAVPGLGALVQRHAE